MTVVFVLLVFTMCSVWLDLMCAVLFAFAACSVWLDLMCAACVLLVLNTYCTVFKYLFIVRTATGRGLGKEEERPAGKRATATPEATAASRKQVGTQLFRLVYLQEAGTDTTCC